MTMKHMDKTISAENEKILSGVADNINGVLTFTFKNLYNGETETKSIDLSKHRLNLIEKSVTAFQNMVSTNQSFYTDNNSAQLKENASGIFLVPTQQSGEGIYEEFYWGEITDSNDYKQTDYIDSNNKHYNFISLQSMNINLQPIQDELDSKADYNHNHNGVYANATHYHTSSNLTDVTTETLTITYDNNGTDVTENITFLVIDNS